MALQKIDPSGSGPSVCIRPSSFSCKVHERTRHVEPETSNAIEPAVDIDLSEVYFLIMHFLSAGPCHRTFGQFWNELLEHQLLPKRYHAWYSRTGARSGDEDDDGTSFPLSYNMLVERYPHIQKDHLVKLLKQLLLDSTSKLRGTGSRFSPHAADVPTLLGEGSFSLLNGNWGNGSSKVNRPPAHLRWPHTRADQVRGLGLREIGGGFARHHRAPSIRAASYAIAKPSTMVQKMQNVKRVRGHRNAVYCATFDRSGRYVITGSDDRLVKIWSMETAYCLASCRGHEGDVTDLAVSSNNAMVASSSNDYIIRVWRLPDGLPISVLRGHTAAVTAIAFNPRPSSVYHLLSSADDGTCRIWDARNSQLAPRIYSPRTSDSAAGRNSGPSSNAIHQNHQIFCCAFNANGTVFVTGSSDTYARVWNACKPSANDSDQPIHEVDVLSGHGNDVNYVQFSGCAVASRYFVADSPKHESTPKFKNTWYSHENIVTCSRDGSAIIWMPRSRRSHGKFGRWTRAYHLKVPPPPMPPQPPRGGPRTRSIPTPRGVNMIMWSLDNRFVLAAIMDCRICVWNASDGSLVHSLTGHTESTYVLDVHPFNPRIAMSAGYDGKTIVWDIWEGIPIKTYEISHFKLVDGKFSPDGTSITLSDDVGQLYILSTGQGESQNDAKYDQFFLGDFRPLIRDSYGNVLDQESQLAPYRRNMQDLLCDSAMIPYEEPYQTMYQQRRLGTLGTEWRPSSLRFAVGPDFNLDEDHHILPLADLDASFDPLPEFIDVIDWEPENEVQSDENDSEYDIAEDFSIEGEQGSLSSHSYGDSDSHEEDSEDEESNVDGLRRSKRKKERADTEIMTSSGRRVKRRNMDECEGSSLRSIQGRKSRNDRKAPKKSSKSKSGRPRRAAARNALSLFSKISGTSDGEDEGEDSSEGDTSESESMPQYLSLESEDSDKGLENQQYKNLKGKEVLDKTEDAVESTESVQFHLNAGNKRKLVLKLPFRSSTTLVPSDNVMQRNDKGKELMGSSSKYPSRSSETNDHQQSVHFGNSSDLNSSLMGTGNGKPVKVEEFIGLSDKCGNVNIRWGGSKARTKKRARLGDTKLVNFFDISNTSHNTQEEMRSSLKISQNINNDCCMVSSDVKKQTNGDKIDGSRLMNDEFIEDGTPRGCDVADTSVALVKSVPGECSVHGEALKFAERTVKDTGVSSSNSEDRIDHLSELKKSPAPISMKFKISSKSTPTDSSSLSKLKQLSLVESQREKECSDESHTEQKESSVDPLHHEIDKTSTDHGNNISRDSDGKITGESRPAINEPPDAKQQPKRMYTAVYKRSKTHRGRTPLAGDGANMGGETSKSSNSNGIAGGNAHGDLFKGDCGPASNGPKLARGDLNSLRRPEQQEELENTCVSAPTTSRSRSQLQHEGGSSSRLSVGLRSTRSRRVSCYVRDRSPVENKVCHSGKKSNWLMLSVHEEGFLYVPQKGDEVVYLRQGHEGYIEHSHSREEGPWTSLKADIRAMEFCKVEDLEYSTLPGSGDSCCKIKLKFIDPNSSVFNRSFNLILPEVTTFPDFLVERSRFDAAMQKQWVCRDKCEVWWKNDSQGGDWWSGRIVAVKPVSPDYPDSPWERYSVLYSNHSNPTEICLHSPWELRDADHHWVQPHMEEESRTKLLAAIAKLDQSNRSQDRYGLQKLKQVSHRAPFINRFPVPLTLQLIQLRLENNYYRSLDALKHDVSVVLSNFESYFERNADILYKIGRLREKLNRTLSSL